MRLQSAAEKAVLKLSNFLEVGLGVGRGDGIVRWEGFELDTRTGELSRTNGKPVRLPEKSLRILIALLERPGELVTREDLRRRLWPNDTVVEFKHAIDAAMNRLRQTLGDAAENPKFIETLARRGYRWKIPVEWGSAATLAAESRLEGSLIGKRVSHYRVLEILGGGGMGVVYKAEDLKLGRRVALKFLPDELAGDAAAMRRFEREARAASALNHPNICTIYAIEEYEGQPFIAMELLEGRSLHEFIAEPDAVASPAGKMPLRIKALVEIAIQVANGLEAAHQKGIIHRDIKPANVFLTNQGQAKVLDFGLAQLHDFEPAENPPKTSGQPSATAAAWNQLLTLTRTGVTIGTAAYMSPEQVRGERVDLRTDLFSFGLVLYEMAARQRAFAGDTAAVLHDAILNRIPAPVRTLNPQIPAKLETVINRAIEKDLNRRYKTASEMRLDLEEFVQTRHVRLWVVAAAVVIAIASLTGAIWFVASSPPAQKSSLEVRFRQLTTNAPENRALGGAIWPDGKYLVYSDLKGMHVELLRTGEIRSIPQPKELMSQDVDWEVTANWLPNGTQFVANAHQPGRNGETWTSKGTSVWLTSVLGGVPKNLRANAMAYGVSPDGSHISFGTKVRGGSESELWLMNTDGKRAEKFLEARTGESICCLVWSPAGDRILYIVSDLAGAPTLVSRALQGGPLTTIFPPQEMSELNELVWLRDGRIVYSVAEPGAIGDTCNYWIRKIDLKTGARIDQPRRLTNWSGFCPIYGSATADGKQMAFASYATRVSVYLANFDSIGSRVTNARQFTIDESNNDLLDWTPDGKCILFLSNRGSNIGIFKQTLDRDLPQPLAYPNGRLFSARVTPDGKWLFWFDKSKIPGKNGAARLMRVPIKGGTAETILTSTQAGTLLCARAPSDVCAIAERSESRKQIVVSSIDPVSGRGSELARFNIDAVNEWACDISPDGTRIAAIIGAENPIRIFGLSTRKIFSIPAEQLHEKRGISWAADGRSLLVTHGVKGGSELVHLDFHGHFRSLWKNNGGYPPLGLPSPDGRLLAIRSSSESSNMWMMENF